MVDRVILGKRGGKHGLWISKPGFDVNTASLDQLLFTTESGFDSLQFVQVGDVVSTVGNPGRVSIPDLGYKPFVWIVPEVTYSMGMSETKLITWATYVSNTEIDVHVDINNLNYTGVCRYAVMRLKVA